MQERDALVLYLDFDGVLHHSDVFWNPDAGFHLRAPERYCLFQHVELLDLLLRPYPEVKLVLSTSWAQGPHGSLERATSMLSPALRLRVIGQTVYPETTTSRQLSRGQQILADVDQRQPKGWLAVDDDDDGFDRHRDHLVHSHQYEGLAGEGVAKDFSQKLRKRFARGRCD